MNASIYVWKRDVFLKNPAVFYDDTLLFEMPEERSTDIDSELVVLTGQTDVETAVEAMRRGAYDFVAKPWKNAELLEVVAKAAEKKALRRENSALREVITRLRRGLACKIQRRGVTPLVLLLKRSGKSS